MALAVDVHSENPKEDWNFELVLNFQKLKLYSYFMVFSLEQNWHVTYANK